MLGQYDVIVVHDDIFFPDAPGWKVMPSPTYVKVADSDDKASDALLGQGVIYVLLLRRHIYITRERKPNACYSAKTVLMK